MIAKPVAFACLVFYATGASAGSESGFPAWMSVSTQAASQQQVGELFNSVRRTAFSGGGVSAGAPWYKERYYDLREPDGSESTRWYFSHPQDAISEPRFAARFQLSEHLPYHVEVVAYCDSGACAELMEQLRRMPPPAPARVSNSWMRAAWLTTIFTEPCSPGPADKSPGTYPTEELRRRIGGRVGLRLAVNRCGEVRGALSIRSSGNRNLDRAARRQALSWRVEVKTGTSAPHFWSNWTEFGSTDGWEAKDESVATGEFQISTSFYP